APEAQLDVDDDTVAPDRLIIGFSTGWLVAEGQDAAEPVVPVAPGNLGAPRGGNVSEVGESARETREPDGQPSFGGGDVPPEGAGRGFNLPCDLDGVPHHGPQPRFDPGPGVHEALPDRPDAPVSPLGRPTTGHP